METSSIPRNVEEASKTKKKRPNKVGANRKSYVRSKQERKDDSIMNTNDSSIVSKRSVAKLYFPNEPDFYEPFVGRYIRRNPLINRGYWLRMHAIEQVVRQFLEEDPNKKKIVVNLGCGYDPLPFQFWHRHSANIQNAVFVDVDYPQLIGRKRDRILANGLLRDSLLRTNLRPSQSPVCLRSDRYIAIGCDLRDLATLERILKAEIDLGSTSIIFVAEVSLTYMPVPDSDSLISWAATLGDARFCLLEQYLPQGSDHPFAQTMLHHFDKLQTPIQAVKQYPSLSQQTSRFSDAGWSTMRVARNLWDLWSDDAFTPPLVRRELDAIEPFDEWEEFALFAAHYFLLVASNTEISNPNESTTVGRTNPDALVNDGIEGPSMALAHHVAPAHSSLRHRRFGAAFALGHYAVAFYGGQGVQSRTSSIDVLARDIGESEVQPCDVSPPQARICHTITSLSDTSALLVGGRASPAHALADCWLIEHGTWKQVHDLSPARFRHSSVRLTMRYNDVGEQGVMVCGGKTSDGTVLDEWTLWTPSKGWQAIPVDGPGPSARFGAALCTMGSAQDWGVLCGGVSPGGTVLEDLWVWYLATPHPRLKFIDRTNDVQRRGDFTHGRVGASLVRFGHSLLLCGGVPRREILSGSKDFLVISYDPSGDAIRIENPAITLPKSTWPLLVGASVIAVTTDEIVIAGGGAVCFSMGSFWNEGHFTITAGTADSRMWTVSQVSKDVKAARPTTLSNVKSQRQAKAEKRFEPKATTIQRVGLHSPEDFADLVAASEPTIITGIDIGPCTDLWTLELLKEKVGRDREVVVHDCTSERMTFKEKNFQYVKKPFGDFIDGIASGSKAYLRAVSSSQPNKLPTELEDDFPGIASDFQLPDVFSFVKANLHSTPLRISGPVALWLHYDVLANILCQVRGSKTLYLYPPSDVKYLSYPPGGSSSDVDVLTSKDSRLRHTHPHIASLEPGDILFIPPMWSHTAMPEDGVSVAVNVFFRNLDSGYAAGRDVYGNRDLQAYENGRRDVEKIARAFKSIPDDIRKFYLDRLIAELQEKADTVRKAG